MFLIADSGSTKTQWCLQDGTKTVKELFSNGINPFYQTEEEIAEDIKVNVLPYFDSEISAIYFYGAGCGFPEKKLMVSNGILASFPEAKVEVNNDLLAAARGLFGNQPGIACIMGTGSNSCYYDGTEIVQNVSPLGFILGDEGSGAVLGKKLIGDLLKNQLPENLKQAFFEEFATSAAEILEAVYKKPFPNRYLAQFTKFINANIDEPSLQKLVFSSFNEFITRNLLQYNYPNIPIAAVGSIAYHFQNILQEAAEYNGLKFSSILQSPMKGLIDYHTK